MKSRQMIVLVSGAALASLLIAAAADPVYKWVDADGNVHFSQTPPPNATTKVQHLNIDVPPPDPQAAAQEQALIQAQQDQQEKAKQEAEKNKPDPKAEAAKKQQCDDLRSKLNVLRQSGRTATTDANGNLTFLDDDARAKQEKAIQDQIAANCSGGK
ncbi:MAG TPA: DUF4124 domain-containing protein [Gammaproteobacteria bacterium]|nr:DUF4124 domain-containing protein [Gammaproteobacteria bacterium]